MFSFESDREIQRFIEQTVRPISRRLSTDEAVDLRREILCHLHEEFLAYRELGVSEEEAKKAAIDSFGRSKTLIAMPHSKRLLTQFVIAAILLKPLIELPFVLASIRLEAMFRPELRFQVSILESVFRSILHPISLLVLLVQTIVVHRSSGPAWRSGSSLVLLYIVTFSASFLVFSLLGQDAVMVLSRKGFIFAFALMLLNQFTFGVALRMCFDWIEKTTNQKRIKRLSK